MIAEILSLLLMSQRDDFHSENCHIYLTSVCWHRRSPFAALETTNQVDSSQDCQGPIIKFVIKIFFARASRHDLTNLRSAGTLLI